MSLISCPVCKNQCSLTATTCPSCGHPLIEGKNFQKIAKDCIEKLSSFLKNQSANSRKWMIFTIIAGVISFSLLTVAIYKVSKYVSRNPQLERELCEASINGELAKVETLVKKGVDVNTTVYKEGNPLTLAILYAAPATVDETPSQTKRLIRLQLVRFLLDNGADVNRGIGNNSPLVIARITDDDKDLEEMLILAGANPNTENEVSAIKLDRKLNAAVWKLSYYLEAQKISEEQLEQEKRKIIEGRK